MDRLHHPLEHRVEELARLLGIAVGEQLHRALEVGEEHRDLLALALQGALRGEDLLGEVLGGVALRRGETGSRRRLRRSGRKSRPATIAELAPGLHPSTAAGTDDRKRRAALSAESCPFAVLRLAPGTRHRGRPPNLGAPGRTPAWDEWSEPSRGLSAGQSPIRIADPARNERAGHGSSCRTQSLGSWSVSPNLPGTPLELWLARGTSRNLSPGKTNRGAGRVPRRRADDRLQRPLRPRGARPDGSHRLALARSAVDAASPPPDRMVSREGIEPSTY